MPSEGHGVFDKELSSKISSCKVLLVGAGGIGCEILKNLVLTGFNNVQIIDLDTIDVSNLNRQFLFRKEHVGKSKAEVAKSAALSFSPQANVIFKHDSIISNEYGVNFFSSFDLVLNALDNRQARNHVNRLCLASKVPLVESGTAGYTGQVELILKGETKCYECDPKPPQKSYPGCTIRNTPTELIHCIVWAKHLYNQLFGEEDPDQDVSPDTEDPEAKAGGEENIKEDGNVKRVSTRGWAQESNYDSDKLFNKLFRDDIDYLLKMENLWKKRRPPTPLDLDTLPDANEGSSKSEALTEDERIWPLRECAQVFSRSIQLIHKQFKELGEGACLVWDKDDNAAMDFVASVANLRAHAFNISTGSRFKIKSMAGNIIPAIATSNAIIAGLVVMHALNILNGKKENCQSVYLRTKPNHKGQMIVRERKLIPPNPECRVCADQPQVLFCANLDKMTCKQFENDVVKGHLNMAAPDVMIATTGSVFISSEEGETSHNESKTLREIGVVDGSVLVADDFLQNYELKIIVTHRELSVDEGEFIVSGKAEDLQPKEAKVTEEKKSGEEEEAKGEESDDDDIMMIEEELPQKKRKIEEAEPSSAKKRKTLQASGTYADPILL